MRGLALHYISTSKDCHVKIPPPTNHGHPMPSAALVDTFDIDRPRSGHSIVQKADGSIHMGMDSPRHANLLNKHLLITILCGFQTLLILHRQFTKLHHVMFGQCLNDFDL